MSWIGSLAETAGSKHLLGADDTKTAGNLQVKQPSAVPSWQVSQEEAQSLQMVPSFHLPSGQLNLQSVGPTVFIRALGALQDRQPEAELSTHVRQVELHNSQTVPFFHLLLGHVVSQELGISPWRALGAEQVLHPALEPFWQVRQEGSQREQTVPFSHLLLGQLGAHALGAVF